MCTKRVIYFTMPYIYNKVLCCTYNPSMRCCYQLTHCVHNIGIIFTVYNVHITYFYSDIYVVRYPGNTA